MNKSLLTAITILCSLFFTNCTPDSSKRLMTEVEEMEGVPMETLNDENWKNYEMKIEELSIEFEKKKSGMTSEKIKEWHYWYGRHAALELKREFYPISNQIDNILKMGEGFLEGLSGENIEKENGLKDGLNLFDNRK